MEQSALIIHPADSVAVALRDLVAGEMIDDGIVVTETVERGHKIALRTHGMGERVVKYGQAIGAATRAIAAGEWVHSHNLATLLDSAGGATGAATRTETAVRPASATWQGYARADGSVGTRNEIWIIPTVGCVARTAQRMAEAAARRHAGRVDGIYALIHPFGCSQLGDDLGGTRAILASLAAHPNAGGVLLLGLGCESNQLAALLEAIPAESHARIMTLSAQACLDEEEAGAALIDQLLEQASSARRTPQPLSSLRVGLKCGGSDGFSGLTANPLLGRLTDRLVAAGGSAILTEIPEIFGAEHLLLARAASDAVRDAGQAMVDGFKDYFRRHGEPVSENPSPGNIAGGITTLEEKSLGAVQKGGHAPLVDVIGYGARATRDGLTLLEAPGNDAVSSTALAAAGAGLILFTTGRGTPLGFPVPTVKVASNHELAARKPHWIDFDAGRCLNETHDAVDDAFLDRLIAIASGESAANERNGEREIAIWKRGVTL